MRKGTKRVKKYKSLTDEEMSQLKVKPQWWLDMHKPIAVDACMMPFGIHAKAEYEGVHYEGVLHPVE